MELVVKLEKFLGMVHGADFIDVDVDNVTFPAPEEFDVFVRFSDCCSRYCSTFAQGMSRESCGCDACSEE